ncbi:peptide deformylase [Jeotgalicoccus nanhaiensis]|uniref:Peptide deformylase n=1 Tax=Jeotgalicoccus nanhaiensis TaxID=568603 RepID=A0ABR9XVR1_9STAP|nr:peptide deformylase [Jeotgalicoccus nanhaiensis]MBF0752805.1 peptide deformylase [Jeotgalicoccus nanhaiensis]TFU62968.1 peptide deformylase [Jeotgalicoccus nanhaiensis]
MLTMENIVRDGHPMLRKKVSEVAEIDAQTIAELKSMREYLINSQNPEMSEKYSLRAGVGLAAPQIGLDKRMLAIYVADEEGNPEYDYMLINPKVISHSVNETYLPAGEGCLSVDEEIEGIVQRKKRIRVSAVTIDGEKIDIKAKGFLAVVLQHELDHLDGVMFYDHIDKKAPFEPTGNAEPLE